VIGKPIPITDPADPRIAAYRDIRERDLVGRQGLFVAEGKVVLNVLLAERRFAPQSILVLANRLAGLEQLLSHAPPDVPIYVARQEVMDAIAGFHLHRGVLAIAHRREPQPPEHLLSKLGARAMVLVLVGIANHDNLGAIFRNAAAFGADAVLIDNSCCDPLYRKAIRVSVGAVLKTPYAVFDSTDAMLSALIGLGFGVVALSPGGREPLRSARRGERMALVLGTEGEGLPAHLLEKFDTVRIEMAPGFDSLNVAAASAVALHHFALL